MTQKLASPFLLRFIRVPQTSSTTPTTQSLAPYQNYQAPEVDPARPVDAWWYISIWQGTLQVHPGAGISNEPYTLTPGGFLRVHRENMPDLTLTNPNATDALGILVYTGDPFFEYRAQG
jgi:hypothetical protein